MRAKRSTILGNRRPKAYGGLLVHILKWHGETREPLVVDGHNQTILVPGLPPVSYRENYRSYKNTHKAFERLVAHQFVRLWKARTRSDLDLARTTFVVAFKWTNSRTYRPTPSSNAG